MSILRLFGSILPKFDIFWKKWLHHLEHVIVFYLYYKMVEWFKRYSNLKHWVTALGPKFQEREFSKIWGLHRKLVNHKTLHFRSFIAKTNDSKAKVQKVNFCTYLYPFFGKIRILPKWRLRQFIPFNNFQNIKKI